MLHNYSDLAYFCIFRNSFIIMDILVACILVTFASIVSGDNSVAAPTDYMVCKPISGIFGTSSKDGNTVTSVLQGPEGKRGPPGKTGLRGPRGVANYDVVDRIVHERLAHIKSEYENLQVACMQVYKLALCKFLLTRLRRACIQNKFL